MDVMTAACKELGAIDLSNPNVTQLYDSLLDLGHANSAPQNQHSGGLQSKTTASATET